MTFAPLNGVRILDFTSVVVGPVCTWRLAQYGAEVIKVESLEGDLMRGLGGLSPTGQHSGAFLHFNRGKRNIALDLKKQESKEIIKRLIEKSDVIVANIRPESLKRLGLDAKTIRDKYPEKIHMLITGYGTDGPYSGKPTYDSVIQGASGVAGLFEQRDGAPAYVPMLIGDHVVGEIAAGAILAALMNKTGASLEIPMFETMSAFVLQEHLAQASFNPPVGAAGDQRLLNAYNKPLKTKDGFVAVTMNTDPQVKAFLTAIGREELITDARFNSVAARAKNVEQWFKIRGGGLEGKTTQEWLTIFEANDIAAMPINSIEQLKNDPHIKAVKLIGSEIHPTEGETAVIRSSLKVDDKTLSTRTFSQPKGYETLAILKELGFNDTEITELLTSKTALKETA